MWTWFLRKVLGRIVALPIRRRLNAFLQATHTPQVLQEALLRRILSRQAQTEFGRNHHFDQIRSVADFRRQLPVAGYESFEPYIRRHMRGEHNVLVADRKIHMFALTSGTTASRKFIPVTSDYLADYRRGWNLWGLKVYRDHREVWLRPIVQLSGDWQEFHTEAGIPCGSVTGLTAAMQLRIIRWLYCVPPSVGKVKDAAAKYYLVLRLSLPRRVGMIIAANPSTLINLARAGDVDKESLIRDLYDGTLSERFDVPGEVRAGLRRRLRKRHKDRARELEDIVRRTGTLFPKDYWPKDCIIGNWMGGSVGAYLRHYPTYFGATSVRDVGLIASEGRMTIPLADGTPSGVLDVTTQYFEFIPEEEGDSKNPTVLAAHELQVGRTYYILLTTSYGLYRYNIFDVVRCTGFHNKTPLVEFLSKGSHFANITGEKLSEYHVAGAMAEALQELNLRLTTYSMAPCWDDEQPYYGLFVERGDLANREQGLRLLQALEARLAAVNVEYAAKRQSLRLGPLRLALLPADAWKEWDQKRLARTGGTLEQYKHPCLISDPKFRETMQVLEEIRGS
ncbi:MAG: GH3 auxin-responsive promoter family protein [Gemmataceae bacterium]|nr:GH3 auxin-responsive promoter family protein [Gemmataceae bacterium]MCI0740124.1 GH3 auxin-responsive promoter family protein [Gemmataceae bacterium]